jgi:hypothetical protein
VLALLAPQRPLRWTEDLSVRSSIRHVEAAPLLLGWRAKK